jgi:hypothetical protein
MAQNLLIRKKRNPADPAYVHVYQPYIKNDNYLEGSAGHFLADNGYVIHSIPGEREWDRNTGYWKKNPDFQHPNKNWKDWPVSLMTNQVPHGVLSPVYEVWLKSCKDCQAKRGFNEDVSPNFEAFLREINWVALLFLDDHPSLGT